MAQWSRIHLPVQETQVQSPRQEDPTCQGAAKPVHPAVIVDLHARVRELQPLKPVRPSVCSQVCVCAEALIVSLPARALQPARLLCPCDFPGKTTGVGCHFLFQGIFPTQGSNPGLLHCRQILLPTEQLGIKIAPNQKQPQGPSPVNRHTKMWYIHITEYSVSSVQFSRSVMSNSLRPHESPHARPPCPSPTPGVHSDSCLSSQ